MPGGLRRWWTPLLLALALLAGALLRWPVLAANPFHEDEALYSTWALQVASGQDPWLLSAYVDKPPLHIYLLAGLFRLWGPSAPLARLPGFVAGLGSILCLYGLGARLYGQRTGLLAAGFLALSPFHISLSGTAFTDSLLVFWLLAALWAGVSGRWGGAGLMLGLAASTKQHGLLFIPLLLALALLTPAALRRVRRRVVPALPAGGALSIGWVGAAPAAGERAWRSRLASLALGFLAPMAVTTWWDVQRWTIRPSYFDRSLTAYGGLRLNTWAEFVE
ncbi:MAG: hypothetical protein GX605_10565, partial [Chloroflexi bacterium]|nr:hypothetical protein [Chloroflexota bacterium]